MGIRLEELNNIIGVLEKNASKWPETLKKLNLAKRHFRSGVIRDKQVDQILADYRQYASNPEQAQISSVAVGMCKLLNDVVQYCRNQIVTENIGATDLEGIRETGHRVAVLSEGLAMGAFSSVTARFEDFKTIAEFVDDRITDPKLATRIDTCNRQFLNLQKQKYQGLVTLDDLITLLDKNASKWPATLNELRTAKERVAQRTMNAKDVDRVLQEYRPYAAAPDKAKPSGAATAICKRLDGIAKLCKELQSAGANNEYAKNRLQSCARELSVLSEGLANGAFSSVTHRYEDFKYITRDMKAIIKLAEQKAQREGKPMNPAIEQLRSQISECENFFDKLIQLKQTQTVSVENQKTMKGTLNEMKAESNSNSLKNEGGKPRP